MTGNKKPKKKKKKKRNLATVFEKKKNFGEKYLL